MGRILKYAVILFACYVGSYAVWTRALAPTWEVPAVSWAGGESLGNRTVFCFLRPRGRHRRQWHPLEYMLYYGYYPLLVLDEKWCGWLYLEWTDFGHDGKLLVGQARGHPLGHASVAMPSAYFAASCTAYSRLAVTM